jgi:outer membrane protein assembly factor BamB
LVYAGIAPRVVALDAKTGAVVWQTKLRGADALVTVSVDGDRVYAGSAGEVWSLDAQSGSIVWHNEMKGFGMNDVMFPGSAWRTQQRA